MLAMSNSDLAANLAEWRAEKTAKVIADDESLRD
jgi:phosphoribosylcarboxyaminoimidazole (NCAIR) mutase